MDLFFLDNNYYIYETKAWGLINIFEKNKLKDVKCRNFHTTLPGYNHHPYTHIFQTGNPN